MIDDLSIAQRAAARYGIEPPQSLDDATFNGQTYRLILDPVVEFCLDLHPWRFVLETHQLARLSGVASPIAGWRNVFQLPPVMLGDPVRIFTDPTDPDRPFSRYGLQGLRVLTDEEQLHAIVKVRPSPARWPAAFREAVVLALAAELALGIAADKDGRDRLRGDAFGTSSVFPRGGAMGVAIQQSGWSTPPRALALADNPMERARW